MARAEFIEIESWCIKNKILIYATPETSTTVRIVVKYKDNPPKIGEKIYKAKGHKAGEEKWWDVIRILQYKYYKKENK